MLLGVLKETCGFNRRDRYRAIRVNGSLPEAGLDPSREVREEPCWKAKFGVDFGDRDELQQRRSSRRLERTWSSTLARQR